MIIQRGRPRKTTVRFTPQLPQSARLQLRLVINRLNSSSARMPTDKRPDGTYRFQPVDVTEMHNELRSLVDEWLKSKRKFAAVFEDNPDLRKRCEDQRAMLLPDRKGDMQIAFLHRPVKGITPARNDAVSMFLDLLVNPFASKLCGPCKRCGLYFENEMKHDRVYCSRKCSSAETSKQVRAERRAQSEQRKFLAIKDALKLFAKANSRKARSSQRPRKTWKKWVSDYTGISMKWITMAVKSGKLIPPDSPLGR